MLQFCRFGTLLGRCGDAVGMLQGRYEDFVGIIWDAPETLHGPDFPGSFFLWISFSGSQLVIKKSLNDNFFLKMLKVFTKTMSFLYLSSFKNHLMSF